MAASLLMPVVSSVASKAADELIQTVTRMWGVDADRGKLERRLLAIQCLLADAEVKSETNPAVRRWMKDLKAVAYQADDVLDHFQYEALRRQAQSRKSMTSKVLSHFTNNSPLFFRLKVSRGLKKVLDKINELVEEMNKFGLVERAEVPHVPYRQTHSLLDESEEIYGRDKDKELVVKLLLDQQSQQNVQVLPIIGMGGLGKTTLAKMVYNNSRVQKHFEFKMWHCVSENFRATDVVRSIIQLATKRRCDLPDTIELLRGQLQEVIARKRFLLILDDVWNEDPHKWDDLKPLLCSPISCSGSMIIVTTRSHRVASIMGTLPPHELSCLRENDSWELFSKKAFSKGVQEKEEFVTIGRRIVNKCKGLPLALKTMGGLMSSKQQVQEWEAIAETNIGDKDEVLSVLRLSYRHLPYEMRQCFAFCSVFPKDYMMEKDKLIQLWMANGFVHEDETMDLTQRGEFVFNELVWRSFLQDVTANRHFFYFSFEKTGCKMHDLMHDLAKYATEECASAQELIQGKASIKDVRHIKMSRDELIEISSLAKGTSSLRTLLTESTHEDLKELKLVSLRAFCCTNPSSKLFIYAKHLRYLNLSKSHIVRLPDSICMLYNLQSLELNECYNLRYLPEDMATNLRKLSHIYLLGCIELERMPPKLSLLQNLRTLTRFIVGTEDGCGIEELKDLRQLGNRLELWNLRNVKNGSKANLHEKQISELLLSWKHKRIHIPTNDEVNNDEEILESLVPPGNLKLLEVRDYNGLSIPQWMRDPQMFQCLRELTIIRCTRCQDIPIIWLSSSLERLYLARVQNLTTLCKNIYVDAAGCSSSLQVFPRLKSMTLAYLPNLERWTESSAVKPSLVMFPLLEELVVIGCGKLSCFPKAPKLTYLSYRRSHEIRSRFQRNLSAQGCVPKHLPLASWPSLVSLELGLPVNLAMSLEEQKGQHQASLEALRCLYTFGDGAFVSIFHLPKCQLGQLEELNISDCRSIVQWPVEELRCFPRLRCLQILHCNKLEGKDSSSEGIFSLPMLERLKIGHCDSLLEIPKLPASLQYLGIFQCRSLVALPTNLGNLTKLRGLSVDACGVLKALPDGMDGLDSLIGLQISFCPGIEEFPLGLLQRLPALRYLSIWGCPGLKRRCREGGEYFNLIASIPNKYIPGATEQKIKRFVKMFLPFCGGDFPLSCHRF